MTLNNLLRSVFYGLIFASLSMAHAESNDSASVNIEAPSDGAELEGGQPITLQYEVSPGPKGDHVHLYVNDTEVAILRKLKGSYDIAPLDEGRYELSVKIVNRAHVPIGVESSITVDVF